MAEYHVGNNVHVDFNKAAGEAVGQALAHGEKVNIDVVIHSELEARNYGGDDAAERYLEDPDASVFERIEISVNFVGRVP